MTSFKVSWLYGRTFGNGTLYIPIPGKKKEREETGFWFNNQRYQKRRPTNTGWPIIEVALSEVWWMSINSLVISSICLLISRLLKHCNSSFFFLPFF